MKRYTLNSKAEFNSEPVYYCKHCLSLRIRDIPNMEESEYCDKCCSTSIAKTNIKDWEEMYVLKYGHKYINE